MKFFFGPNGQVAYIIGPPPAGSPFNNGLAFHPDGRVYVTFGGQVTDSYIGGLRISALGELFCASLAAPLDFNAGLPSNSAGGGPLAGQFDVPNGPNDGIASGGVRVGPLGGVYFTSTPPSGLLSGFSNGFDAGFGV